MPLDFVSTRVYFGDRKQSATVPAERRVLMSKKWLVTAVQANWAATLLKRAFNALFNRSDRRKFSAILRIKRLRISSSGVARDAVLCGHLINERIFLRQIMRSGLPTTRFIGGDARRPN